MISGEELYGSLSGKDYFYSVFLLLIASVGFLLCTLITIALAKSKTFNPNTVMITSFIINGFLLCIYFIVTLTANLIVGHFAFGAEMCQIYLGAVFIGLEAAILLNIIVMVLNLYLMIIVRMQVTLSLVGTQIAVLWILVIGIVVAGNLLNRNSQYVVRLNPSKTVCTINWADKHVETLYDIVAVLGLILFCIVFVTFVYASVFWAYYKRNRENERHVTDNEKKLFIRTSSICICFVFFWSPYIGLIISEMALSQRSSHLFDAIAVFSVGFFHLSTGWITIFQDPQIRFEIYRMLNIDQKTVEKMENKIKSSIPQVPLDAVMKDTILLIPTSVSAKLNNTVNLDSPLDSEEREEGTQSTVKPTILDSVHVTEKLKSFVYSVDRNAGPSLQ